MKNTHKDWSHSKNVNCGFVPDGIFHWLLMTLTDLINLIISVKDLKNIERLQGLIAQQKCQLLICF